MVKLRLQQICDNLSVMHNVVLSFTLIFIFLILLQIIKFEIEYIYNPFPLNDQTQDIDSLFSSHYENL
jgi:hypothetical protein